MHGAWSLLAAILAGAAGEPTAERSDIDQFSLEELLNPTVASATLSSQSLDTAPSVLSVVTHEELRALGLRTLRDVLMRITGATVLDTQLGEQRLALRGVASPPNLLVTLDGEPLNDLYDGSAPLDLPTENLERVEVIRGPGSALYGSNAFAGVVSLYSRTTEELAGGVGGELSFDHSVGRGVRLHGSAGQPLGRWRVHASGVYLLSTGPKVWVENDNTRGSSYSQVPGETQAPRQNGLFQLSAERKGLFGEADRLKVSADFLFNRRGPYFGPNNVFAPDSVLARSALLGFAEYAVPLGAGVELTTRFSADRRQSDNHVQDQPRGFTYESNGNLEVDPGELFPEGKLREFAFTSFRLQLKPQLVWALQAPQRIVSNLLTVGAELQYEQLADFSYAQNSQASLYAGPALDNYDALPLNQKGRPRWVVAGFAQNQLEPFAGLYITAGLRFDAFSDFGTALNPRLAVVWKPLSFVSGKLLYGHAFRAPTMQELYDQTGNLFTPAGYPIRGNQTLRPETTDTVELGVELSPTSSFTARLNGFALQTRDTIDVDPTFNFAGTTLINFPGRLIVGAEAEGQLLLTERNSLRASVAWFQSRQTGDGLPGFEEQTDRRFVDKRMSDVPALRANAEVVSRPLYGTPLPAVLAELSASAAYSFVAESGNNRRTPFEALNRYTRPAYHEASATLRLPLLGRRLELVSTLALGFGKSIPVTLPTGWYELPTSRASLFVGLESRSLN